MIIYENDGTLREVFSGPYSFSDAHFDKELNIYDGKIAVGVPLGLSRILDIQYT